MLHVVGSFVFYNTSTSNDILYSMISLMICQFEMSFHPHKKATFYLYCDWSEQSHEFFFNQSEILSSQHQIIAY